MRCARVTLIRRARPHAGAASSQEHALVHAPMPTCVPANAISGDYYSSGSAWSAPRPSCWHARLAARPFFVTIRSGPRDRRPRVMHERVSLGGFSHRGAGAAERPILSCTRRRAITLRALRTGGPPDLLALWPGAGPPVPPRPPVVAPLPTRDVIRGGGGCAVVGRGQPQGLRASDYFATQSRPSAL